MNKISFRAMKHYNVVLIESYIHCYVTKAEGDQKNMKKVKGTWPHWQAHFKLISVAHLAIVPEVMKDSGQLSEDVDI